MQMSSDSDISYNHPPYSTKRDPQETVGYLLKIGRDIGSRKGQALLSWAAESGDIALINILLATRKVDVNSEDDKSGRTPLSWAAGNGHVAIVKLLVSTGKVDVDSKDSKFGQTPLSWAAENGHGAIVKLLLSTGKVDVDSTGSKSDRTPLSWAAGKGGLYKRSFLRACTDCFVEIEKLT
jgi:ankyrin repeat protein